MVSESGSATSGMRNGACAAYIRSVAPGASGCAVATGADATGPGDGSPGEATGGIARDAVVSFWAEPGWLPEVRFCQNRTMARARITAPRAAFEKVFMIKWGMLARGCSGI